MSNITFQGSIAQELVKKLPLVQRAAGQAILMKESNNGRAKVTFIQDTLVALLPKAVVSRSRPELSESTFLELLESFLIYFSVPWVGGPMFKSIFSKLLPKHIDPKLLTKPLKEVPTDALKHIIPAKAGIIVSALTLTGIGGEYIINYAKNLLTAGVYKKDKFTDVVNLSNGSVQDWKHSSVVERSKQRIYAVMAASLGLVALSIYGASALPRKFEKMTETECKKWFKGPLGAIVRNLDFKFGKNGAYGLTKNQMTAYMLLSVPAYLDAARDKWERLESATRLAIILPYLLWGQDKLEGLFKGVFEKSDITKPGKHASFNVKSLEELARQTVNSIGKKYKHTIQSSADLAKLPAGALQNIIQEFKPLVNAKAAHIGFPLAVGIAGAGLGVGLLNRELTAYRYRKQEEEKAQKAQNTMYVPVPVPVFVFPPNGQSPFSANAPIPGPITSAHPNLLPFQNKSVSSAPPNLPALTPPYKSPLHYASARPVFSQKKPALPKPIGST